MQSHRAVLPQFRKPAWILLAYLLTVFLVGGGARGDLASLPLLYGVSVILIGYGCLDLGADGWRAVRAPVGLLLALAAWMAVQLIPLPPQWWSALPGHATTAKVDAMLGLSDLWRPLSLTPSLTWGSLLSLTVPLCTLILAAKLTAAEHREVLKGVVAIAIISMLFGLAQLMGGAGSPARLYRITNVDSMVGLFANRNHSAAFLAAVLVLTGMFLRDELLKRKRRTGVIIALSALGAMLVAVILTTGSRAGLALGGLAFLVSHLMIWSAQRKQPPKTGARPRTAGPQPLFHAVVKQSVPWVLLAIVIGLFFASNQMNALGRLADLSAADDLRTLARPTLMIMAGRFWLLGSGFGSFAPVYKMFESDDLLSAQYFNNAHNDWIELVITGGLPAILLLVLALAWVVRQFLGSGSGSLALDRRGDVRLPIAVILIIFVVASAADYPLRVPSLQALVAIVLVVLAKYRVSAVATGRVDE